MIVNKDKFQLLPSDLQEIVKKGIESLNIWMQCEFDSKNSLYLNKLINEENVKLKMLPKDVLMSFKEKSNEVVSEMIEKDPKSKKIFEAYEKFRVSFRDWSVVSDKIYYEL
jgi:TRAP-type mannitol/chloroaromatic compound transport system substrate-binding protein